MSLVSPINTPGRHQHLKSTVLGRYIFPVTATVELPVDVGVNGFLGREIE